MVRIRGSFARYFKKINPGSVAVATSGLSRGMAVQIEEKIRYLSEISGAFFLDLHRYPELKSVESIPG